MRYDVVRRAAKARRLPAKFAATWRSRLFSFRSSPRPHSHTRAIETCYHRAVCHHHYPHYHQPSLTAAQATSASGAGTGRARVTNAPLLVLEHKKDMQRLLPVLPKADERG